MWRAAMVSRRRAQKASTVHVRRRTSGSCSPHLPWAPQAVAAADTAAARPHGSSGCRTRGRCPSSAARPAYERRAVAGWRRATASRHARAGAAPRPHAGAAGCRCRSLRGAALQRPRRAPLAAAGLEPMPSPPSPPPSPLPPSPLVHVRRKLRRARLHDRPRETQGAAARRAEKWCAPRPSCRVSAPPPMPPLRRAHPLALHFATQAVSR